MTSHAERRTLPYTPEQLYELVADVKNYPQFLPWCISSRVRTISDTMFHADLVIGYKMIREKYGSRVTLNAPDHIHVEYTTGPMKYLSNHWRFIREDDGSCTIDFFVEFEFKNKILQNLIGVFFNEIVQRMVSAFEKRARDLYGESGVGQEVKRSRDS